MWNFVRQYYYLHVQHYTAFFADAFKSFRNKCFEIYKIGPANFLSAPVLAWQECLKKTEVKLVLFYVTNVLFYGICPTIHKCANNKYMKNYDLSTELSCLMFWGVSNLYGWTCCKSYPADSFKGKHILTLVVPRVC